MDLEQLLVATKRFVLEIEKLVDSLNPAAIVELKQKLKDLK